MKPKGRRWHWLALLLVLGAALGFGIPRLMPDSAAAVHPQHGMVCTTGPTFNLRASSGYIQTPDGNSVYMWSFQKNPGFFQYPGPTLCVNEGDTVTVNLTNDLPEPVSIVFPGQSNVLADGSPAQPQFDGGGNLTSLTQVAAPAGGTVSYSFVAEEPGTYIYESGTEPSKQVQMGLVGALVIRPSLGANYAYNDVSTLFNADREFLLLFHEIDPDLHHAVELGQPFDVTLTHFRYWTVNGRALPDSIQINNTPWLPSQPYSSLIVVEPYDGVINAEPALIRIANPGVDNHPFHPHANHIQTIAQDGRLLKGPSGEDLSFEQFGRIVGAGQTYDALFTWTDAEGWDPDFNPVPVEIPGLQNLVFMDSAVYYSGSPYLGYQGDFPPGVTSFNQCGEEYFPWHSHALNEFQNFDEGFGGLATLLRVDPPGGCP
jgi:FtsP/CotA-like multicopper oxidase with cupredoxin domain